MKIKTETKGYKHLFLFFFVLVLLPALVAVAGYLFYTVGIFNSPDIQMYLFPVLFFFTGMAITQLFLFLMVPSISEFVFLGVNYFMYHKTGMIGWIVDAANHLEFYMGERIRKVEISTGKGLPRQLNFRNTIYSWKGIPVFFGGDASLFNIDIKNIIMQKIVETRYDLTVFRSEFEMALRNSENPMAKELFKIVKDPETGAEYYPHAAEIERILDVDIPGAFPSDARNESTQSLIAQAIHTTRAENVLNIFGTLLENPKVQQVALISIMLLAGAAIMSYLSMDNAQKAKVDTTDIRGKVDSLGTTCRDAINSCRTQVNAQLVPSSPAGG